MNNTIQTASTGPYPEILFSLDIAEGKLETAYKIEPGRNLEVAVRTELKGTVLKLPNCT